MLGKKSIVSKLIALAIMSSSIFICSGFLFFSKNFENKNDGKYKYYIDECESIRNKEVKKAKSIEGSYNLKYENVIFEKEAKKDDMVKEKNNNAIAKYIVCIFDEYDVKNKNGNEKIKESSYYVCDVTKEEFRKVLSKQLEDTNKKHQGIAEILGAVGEGAVGGASVGAIAGTVTIPGIGTVGLGAIGGAIGAVGAGAYKAYDLFIKGEIDLDVYIKEWTDEEYEKTFLENMQYYNFKTKKIKQDKLNQYISADDLKIVDGLEKKYNKK